MVVGMSDAQKPAWKECAGSLVAEVKQNLHCGHLDCYTSSNTGYCQPRLSPVPETAI